MSRARKLVIRDDQAEANPNPWKQIDQLREAFESELENHKRQARELGGSRARGKVHPHTGVWLVQVDYAAKRREYRGGSSKEALHAMVEGETALKAERAAKKAAAAELAATGAAA